MIDNRASNQWSMQSYGQKYCSLYFAIPCNGVPNCWLGAHRRLVVRSSAGTVAAEGRSWAAHGPPLRPQLPHAVRAGDRVPHG